MMIDLNLNLIHTLIVQNSKQKNFCKSQAGILLVGDQVAVLLGKGKWIYKLSKGLTFKLSKISSFDFDLYPK